MPNLALRAVKIGQNVVKMGQGMAESQYKPLQSISHASKPYCSVQS